MQDSKAPADTGSVVELVSSPNKCANEEHREKHRSNDRINFAEKQVQTPVQPVRDNHPNRTSEPNCEPAPRLSMNNQLQLEDQKTDLLHRHDWLEKATQ
jgi:hypothetical protein